MVARGAILFSVALMGAVFGTCAGGASSSLFPSPIGYLPLPHQVPRLQGDVSFRFAMAHDVIHERYPKHGPAHFRERERLTRAKLKELKPEYAAVSPLIDDLAAAMHRLDESDAAIAVLRDKFKAQQAKGQSGAELYTTYSNLGTILLLANEKRWRAGDTAAKTGYREGVEFVRKSYETYPQAHFGRQRWQAAIGEFILVPMEDRQVLTKFDCVGNRLDLEIRKAFGGGSLPEWERDNGRPHTRHFGEMIRFTVPKFSNGSIAPDDPDHWPDLVKVREYVTKVGAEEGWPVIGVTSHRERVPFDEPALAITTMWRQTSGATPHFALALGEIMLRVGQRYIAWTSFERAFLLADQFSPDPKRRQFLRDHCRKRQEDIEWNLRYSNARFDYEVDWERTGLPPKPEIIEELRKQFDAELAFGERYQREYQEYEATKIAAGASIDDPHFFDEFHAGRPWIASKSGPEEWYAYESGSINARIIPLARNGALLGAGIAAMLAALMIRWKVRYDRRPPVIIRLHVTDPPATEDSRN